MSLKEALDAYAAMGYEHFEVFTSWANSAVDYHSDSRLYLKEAKERAIDFTSFHLPPISAGDLSNTLQEAVAASRFADAIGAEIAIYKATDRQTYISAARTFLDAVEDLRIIPVIQNHYGTPLSSLEDVKEVFEGIADSRMRTLLEVGQFHSAGVDWREAADYLGESIALVHIKDQIGTQSVPFGRGDIDLPGLFYYLDERSYTGRYVIEMEVTDGENTLKYLSDALTYVRRFCEDRE